MAYDKKIDSATHEYAHEHQHVNKGKKFIVFVFIASIVTNDMDPAQNAVSFFLNKKTKAITCVEMVYCSFSSALAPLG